MNPKIKFLMRDSDINNSLNTEIYLCHTGWEFCMPGYQFGPHIRDFYLIHFITSGKGTFYVNDKSYSLIANDVFLIRPGEVATYRADENNPWDYYFFAFNGIRAAELIPKLGFTDDNPITHLSDLKLARLIEETTLQTAASQMPPLFGLSALLRMLLCFMDAGEQPGCSPTESYVRQAKSYIQLHCNEEISVSSVSAMLSLHRSHFFRIFRQSTGQTPSEFILSCRLENACRLLIGTQIPIEEIARTSGFASCPYFYRTFKRHTGQSPGEYRTTHDVMQ